MRLSLRIAILLLVAALVAQTWLVLGLVGPVVVAGGSMAPGLVGEHYQVACPNCSLTFNCGAESLPADQRVVCPRCGALSEIESARLKPADRLFVDRTAFLRIAPHALGHRGLPLARWRRSPVRQAHRRAAGRKHHAHRRRRLCRRQDRPQGLADVGGNGHCGRFRPAPARVWRRGVDLAARRGRQSLAADRRRLRDWLPTDGPPAVASADRVDWLTYHHEQIIRQGDNVVRREGPILDDLAYNQDESRELVAVPDAILSCRLQSERGRRTVAAGR